MELAKWGRFSVIQHLTLPLRYFLMNILVCIYTFGCKEQTAELFKVILQGIGIELNTNPVICLCRDRNLLQLYSNLGGELITIGSDTIHRNM